MFAKPYFAALVTLASAVSFAPSSGAFTVDGSGHYALRGEWQNNPGMGSGTGLHQAIAQSCRLLGEARANDRGSFFLELRLLDRNGQSYLGDKAQSPQCQEFGADANDCITDHQSVTYPAYKPYQPQVSKAYARYSFDYFILEAGRRGRNWGLGIFLDDGSAPFAPTASIFDGVTFDVNLQQFQTLGFSFGFDKLAETGALVRKLDDANAEKAELAKHGPASPNDDIDQAFLTIEYDDRVAYAGSPFTKQIGIYAARVHSGEVKKGGSSTDITYFDVFANLHVKNFNFKHEMLLTLGKSADPNLVKLGGSLYDEESEAAVNKFNTVSFAGTAGWSFARKGAFNGPPEYLEGDFTDHSVFVDYAFAPGAEEGYYNDRRLLEGNQVDDKHTALKISKRTKKRADAFAFHRNFRPALILFNGRNYIHNLAVDGIFDPGQFMNAQLYAAGYRYDSVPYGLFEVKTIYARLQNGIPGEVKSFYDDHPTEKRPIGYAGNELGLELDLTYTKKVTKNFNFGFGAGYLVAGNAWNVDPEEDARNSFLGQTFLGFQF